MMRSRAVQPYWVTGSDEDITRAGIGADQMCDSGPNIDSGEPFIAFKDRSANCRAARTVSVK